MGQRLPCHARFEERIYEILRRPVDVVVHGVATIDGPSTRETSTNTGLDVVERLSFLEPFHHLQPGVDEREVPIAATVLQPQRGELCVTRHAGKPIRALP